MSQHSDTAKGKNHLEEAQLAIKPNQQLLLVMGNKDSKNLEIDQFLQATGGVNIGEYKFCYSVNHPDVVLYVIITQMSKNIMYFLTVNNYC